MPCTVFSTWQPEVWSEKPNHVIPLHKTLQILLSHSQHKPKLTPTARPSLPPISSVHAASPLAHAAPVAVRPHPLLRVQTQGGCKAWCCSLTSPAPLAHKPRHFYLEVIISVTSCLDTEPSKPRTTPTPAMSHTPSLLCLLPVPIMV